MAYRWRAAGGRGKGMAGRSEEDSDPLVEGSRGACGAGAGVGMGTGSTLDACDAGSTDAQASGKAVGTSLGWDKGQGACAKA